MCVCVCVCVCVYSTPVSNATHLLISTQIGRVGRHHLTRRPTGIRRRRDAVPR